MITNVLDMGTTWYKGISKRQMIEAQKNDPILKKIRPLLIAGEAPPKSKMRSEGEDYRTFVRLWKKLLIQDGIMYRKVNQPPLKKSRIQYILPNSLKSHVLRACHNAPMTGHMGHTRTLHRIIKKFFWPAYKKDIKSWIMKCIACQRRKCGPRTVLQN